MLNLEAKSPREVFKGMISSIKFIESDIFESLHKKVLVEYFPKHSTNDQRGIFMFLEFLLVKPKKSINYTTVVCR